MTQPDSAATVPEQSFTRLLSPWMLIKTPAQLHPQSSWFLNLAGGLQICISDNLTGDAPLGTIL